MIVPAYNEAAAVATVVGEIRGAMPDARVVVVDDGSTDQTGRVAGEAGALVLTLPFNMGIGAAVQTGYRYARDARAQVAVQMDADGQHDPAAISTLLDPIRRQQADLVVGSRFIQPGGFRSSVVRRAGISLLAWLTGVILRRPVTDPTSGFRACGPRAIALFAETYPPDYPEPESLVSAVRQGLRIEEVAVTMRPRAIGVSSISPLRAVYYMSKVVSALLCGAGTADPGARLDRMDQAGQSHHEH